MNATNLPRSRPARGRTHDGPPGRDSADLPDETRVVTMTLGELRAALRDAAAAAPTVPASEVPAPSHWLTTDEVAALCCVTVHTVRRWCGLAESGVQHLDLEFSRDGRRIRARFRDRGRYDYLLTHATPSPTHQTTS